MIAARCDWLEDNGLLSWRPSLDDLVSQADNPCGDVWVLELDGSRLVGRTTLQEQGPPWGWTDAERAGAGWVRRDCAFPELAKYYQSQGYELVREADRKGHRLFMMARKAERLDLTAAFQR